MPKLVPLQAAPAVRSASSVTSAGTTSLAPNKGPGDQLGSFISQLNGTLAISPATAAPEPAPGSAPAPAASATTAGNTAPTGPNALAISTSLLATQPKPQSLSPATSGPQASFTSRERKAIPADVSSVPATAAPASPPQPGAINFGAVPPSPATTGSGTTAAPDLPVAPDLTAGQADATQPTAASSAPSLLDPAAAAAPPPALPLLALAAATTAAHPPLTTRAAPKSAPAKAPLPERRQKQTTDASTPDQATNPAAPVTAANLTAVPLLPTPPAQLSSQPSPLQPAPQAAPQLAAAKAHASKAPEPLAASGAEQAKPTSSTLTVPGSPMPADAAHDYQPTAAQAAAQLQSAAPPPAQPAHPTTAQASQPAASGPSPPPAVQVAQAIADPVRVVLAAPAQHSNAPHVTTIQLDPADLGRVEIRIERTDNGPAKIELAVERPETLLRLVHDAPQLQQTLDQAGIPQQGRTVSFSLASDNGASFSSANFTGGNGQRPSNGNGSARTSAAETDEIPPLTPTWSRIGLNITA